MQGIKTASASGDTTIKNAGRKDSMEFLKEILGEELYNQLKAKVDAYNGDESNKENQIKIGNLGSGEYVGKGKYDALQELLNGKETELSKASGLIEELKKGTKGDEDLQGKIKTYETENTKLQEELKETKLKSAIKVALLSEKCSDVDYVSYKLSEKLKSEGKDIELDENDSIKGWKDIIDGLKTQLPAQFETQQKADEKKYEERKLPKSEERKGEPKDLEEAIRMKYENTNE